MVVGTNPASNVLQGDFSPQYSSQPFSSSEGEFGRTWLGEFFGSNRASERDDWIRQEQSSNNAFVRDLAILQAQNKFNAEQAELAYQRSASEAQKQRNWQADMERSYYSRLVSSLQDAGLNPILAYQHASLSAPSGAVGSAPSASSSSGSVSRGSSSPHRGSALSTVVHFLGSALMLAAGLYK